MALVFRDASSTYPDSSPYFASSTYSDSNIRACQESTSNDTLDHPKNKSISQELPRHLEVVIRPSQGLAGSGSWHTASMFPRNKAHCEHNALKGYSQTGLTILLRFVVDAIINYTSPSMPEYSLSTKGIGCQQKWIDPIQKLLRFLMPVTLPVLYLPCVLFVARRIMKECKANMRRTLSLVGVQERVYTLFWGLIVVMEVLLLAAGATAIFFLPGFAAFSNSNPAVVFGFFVMYGLSVMSISTWLTDFISRDGYLVVAIATIHMGQTLFVVYTSHNQSRLRVRETLLMSFLASHLLDQGSSILTVQEETGEGVSWSNFMMPPTRRDNLSLATCLLMLALNTVVGVGVRLACRDAGDFCRCVSAGRRRLINCVRRTPVSGGTSITETRSSTNVNSFVEEDSSSPVFLDFDYEAERRLINCVRRTPVSGGTSITETRSSTNVNSFVEEDSSSPVFLDFDYEAERDYNISSHPCQWKRLHFKVYRNKTTVLLGCHAPDYSQVIRMLSGQARSSSARVTVLGSPLQQHLKDNTRFMGVCFQQQAVFDDLNVKENMQLFSQLAGVPKRGRKLEIENISRHFALLNKLEVKAGQLSTYWYMILRLALASIGDPQILFIEDPTRDLDQVQVKKMLHVLTQLMSTRTFLVTTANTEEAFQLAEKVAVNVDGVTVCFGSKDFVRQCFGAGYRLETKLAFDCRVEALINYMQLFVSTLVVLKKSESQLICLLPQNTTHKFEFLIGNLYMKDVELGIRSLQINDVTMDELLSKLRNYKSAQAHLLEVEKYQMATEAFSLKTPSDWSLFPRVLHSSLAKSNSVSLSLMKQQSLEGRSLVNWIFGYIGRLSITDSQRNNSVTNDRSITQDRDHLSFTQNSSGNVELKETS